jgi:predicted membrane-bound spermidine synthase
MIRATALLLTVLTGFAGLVYEVTWQKYLATLLGSHAEATAAVLAIFLGGLSVGYALFCRATRRMVERARLRARPLRLLLFYAVVEAAIGLYALLFPSLFGVAQTISLLVPPGHEALAFAFDVGLAALLIGPPTVLMGGTIPILTLALAPDVERATRVHAWVYGLNTAGAFAGALAGGFFLIPALGLDGVMRAMGCVNLLAGIAFAGLERASAGIAPELASESSARSVPSAAAFSIVALLAGFAAMSLQTTLIRLGGLALGASQFTFAMVVSVFVLCIALGSLLVSALPRIPRIALVGSQWLLVLLLVPLYVGLADVAYWGHVLRVLLRSSDAAFFAYQLLIFLGVLGVLAIPIGLSGALLPLLFHALRGRGAELGAVAGRLYAWNTVGSLLGALLGGYLLLLWLDLHHVYRIATSALVVGAGILTVSVLRVSRRLVWLVIVPFTLGGVWWLAPWSQDRLAAGLFRQRMERPSSFVGPEEFFARRRASELLFYDDDPSSSVSVQKPRRNPRNLSIVVNGKSDGALEADFATMALSALVPALLAEHHENCFVIGWGTGVTAGELAALEGTRRVQVAEISRAVIAAAPFFDQGNLRASKNPKIEIRRGDAYRTLLSTDERFDVIVSEPSNPWVAGVEMLYSREFLEAARSRLAPGGVYGQWFHLYESDSEVVELVLRTYASVFPQVSVWFTLGPDLLLLGFDRPERALDVAALEADFRRPDFAAGFGRVGIESFAQLLAHEILPLGTLHALPLPGDVHTLRHPILSHRAARAFFRGRAAEFPALALPEQARVGARNSLLRRYAGEDGLLSEAALEAAARESCRFKHEEHCATFLARWRRDHPHSARLEATLAELRENGKRAPGLQPATIARLIALFEGPSQDSREGIRPQLAAQLTRGYLSHFHYAVPFDRAKLEAIWRRCQGQDCADGRRLVEERVGPLGQG